LQALVDGVALPGVVLAHPIREVTFVSLDDLHAPVGAAAVDDDVLEVGVVLVEHGADGSLEVRTLVERWGDHRDPGIRSGLPRAGGPSRHLAAGLPRVAWSESTTRPARHVKRVVGSHPNVGLALLP